jgi:hypothetical protein
MAQVGDKIRVTDYRFVGQDQLFGAEGIIFIEEPGEKYPFHVRVYKERPEIICVKGRFYELSQKQNLIDRDGKVFEIQDSHRMKEGEFEVIG